MLASQLCQLRLQPCCALRCCHDCHRTSGNSRRGAQLVGGCKRLASSVYDEARTILTSFVNNVMADTSVLLEMTGRKTVRAADILFALKKQGRTLYAVA